MAVTIRGIQPLQWGLDVTSGYVTDNITDAGATQEHIIEDENGDICTQILGFGNKREITLEVIPKSATTKPTLGVIFAVGVGPLYSINIISLEEKKVKKDVVKWTIKGTLYPNVTPS